METTLIWMEGCEISNREEWETLEEKYKDGQLKLLIMENEFKSGLCKVVRCGEFKYLSQVRKALAEVYEEYLKSLVKRRRIDFVSTSQLKYRDHLHNHVLKTMNFKNVESKVIENEILALTNIRVGKLPSLTIKEAGYYIDGIQIISLKNLMEYEYYEYTALGRSFFLFATFSKPL